MRPAKKLTELNRARVAKALVDSKAFLEQLKKQRKR